MNKLEYGLIKLSEECSEVAKEAIKCMLFGLHSTHPTMGGPSNIVNLGTEVDDFLAVVAFLEKELNDRGLTYSPNLDYIQQKVSLLETYYQQLYGDKNEGITTDQNP